MTKQEEMRGVIDAHTDDVCLYPNRDCEWRQGGWCVHDENAYKCLMKRLDELGVVIKVKCLDCSWSQFEGESVGMTACYSCNSTGYIIEPLIKE